MKRKTKTDQVPLREAIALNRRAFDLWCKQYPMMLVSSAAYLLISSLTPYVGIYLSARIIDELAGARNPQSLMRLAVLALVLTAALTMLNAALLRWKNCQHSTNYYKIRKILTDKLLEMDFCDVDDQRAHELYSRIRQDDNWGGWGLKRTVTYFESIAGQAFSIAGAVALTVSLFTSRVPDGVGGLALLNHPLLLVLIVALMLAVTLLAPLCASRAESYWTRCSEDGRFGNRYSFFIFMNQERYRALDIRMYRQDVICAHYADRTEGFGLTPGFPPGGVRARADGRTGGAVGRDLDRVYRDRLCVRLPEIVGRRVRRRFRHTVRRRGHGPVRRGIRARRNDGGHAQQRGVSAHGVSVFRYSQQNVSGQPHDGKTQRLQI